MKRYHLLMLGNSFFNKQIREIALSSDVWHVAELYYSSYKHNHTCLLAFLKSLRGIDILYQSGGSISTFHIMTYWIAHIFKKHVVLHWVGTDVLNAIKRFKQRRKLPRIFNFIHHWATAPWLVEELKQVGIMADFVPFTGVKRKSYLSMEPPSLPAKFTVLSYIPDERPDSYGWGNILKLAREFPQIDFNIIRGTGKFANDVPTNIHFHGWLDDTYNIYSNSTLIIRGTNHDGYTGSVQEPLALGRYVIWKYPFPGVIEVKDYGAMRDQVAKLFDLHQQGLLSLNIEGRLFLLENLNPDNIAINFESKLRQVLSS